MMKKLALSVMFLAAFAVSAHAACVAEYKASRGSPPKFTYGVVQLPEGVCTEAAAMPIVRAELSRQAQDWKQIRIVSIQER